MASKTFLVTAATGTVGRPLAKRLLAMGHKVHALTTNPDSDRARDIANAGAKLFRASLDDKAAIAAAAASCTGVYLNPMPANIANHFNEATYAQNIIQASRDAGVRVCVCQSVQGADSIAASPEWTEWIGTAGIVAEYWKMKIAILDAVRSAGFESWTAIQGSMHMSNFGIRYLSMLFPGVHDKPTGSLSFAVREDTPLHLIDPADLAELAARALTDPQRWNGLAFDASGESMTLSQIATVVAKHAGKPIKAHYPDPEEIEAKRATDLGAGNGEVLRIFADRTDFGICQSSGIKFNTLDSYLKERQDELRQAVA